MRAPVSAPVIFLALAWHEGPAASVWDIMFDRWGRCTT